MSYVSCRKKIIVDAERSIYVNENNSLHEFRMKSPVSELRSPTPCPGSRGSSADGTHVANQNMAHLKDEIVNEIKREVSDPMIEMLTKILNEIQTLKKRSETTGSFSNVSCQTEWPTTSTDSATFAVNNNDETIYDVPRLLNDQNNEPMCNSYTNLAYVSRASNSEQSQLNPIFDSRMIPADESAVQTPTLPPRENSYPNLSHAVQGHAISNIFRSNSVQTRGNVVQVKPRPKSEVQPNTVNQAANREVLANTLQSYIEDIVEGLAYQTEKLLDDLVVEGCLTRDEWVTVKNIGDEKDHLRALLSLMKGKDLKVLEGFMKLITRYNKEVAQRITDKVGSSMQRDAQRGICGVCKIKKEVNIKEIADSLWSVKAIDDNLYNQIIRPDSNSVEQSILWEKVFHSFSSITTKQFDPAKTKLLDYLYKKDISLGIEISDILEKNQGKLLCICRQKFGGHNDTVQHSASNIFVKHAPIYKTGAVVPVIKGGKGSHSYPTNKESKESGDISKPKAHLTVLPNGQEKSQSDNSIKPPLLPKRPSPIRKPKQYLSSTLPRKCEIIRKVQSDASLYDIPTAHLTKSSDKSKEHTSYSDDSIQGFSTIRIFHV